MEIFESLLLRQNNFTACGGILGSVGNGEAFKLFDHFWEKSEDIAYVRDDGRVRGVMLLSNTFYFLTRTGGMETVLAKGHTKGGGLRSAYMAKRMDEPAFEALTRDVLSNHGFALSGDRPRFYELLFICAVPGKGYGVRMLDHVLRTKKFYKNAVIVALQAFHEHSHKVTAGFYEPHFAPIMYASDRTTLTNERTTKSYNLYFHQRKSGISEQIWLRPVAGA